MPVSVLNFALRGVLPAQTKCSPPLRDVRFSRAAVAVGLAAAAAAAGVPHRPQEDGAVRRRRTSAHRGRRPRHKQAPHPLQGRPPSHPVRRALHRHRIHAQVRRVAGEYTQLPAPVLCGFGVATGLGETTTGVRRSDAKSGDLSETYWFANEPPLLLPHSRRLCFCQIRPAVRTRRGRTPLV